MDSINVIICRYIYKNWIVNAQSQRAFASDHDIEESTVRKIKNTALGTNNTEYNIPINTLRKICVAEDLSLEEFFKRIKQ